MILQVLFFFYSNRHLIEETMEFENILSILIKKIETLVLELGVFTPEEIMYLLGFLFIALFLLINISKCLEKTFPIIIKILKVFLFGMVNIIIIMTVIMLGRHIIDTNNTLSIDTLNKISFPIICENIINWMRTPFKGN